MIHCIGDSHITLFTGQDVIPPVYPEPSHDLLPEFQTYRLGAVLAYNLKETGHTSHGREKLLSALSTIAAGSKVLLVFGEVDIRTQLIKQAKQQKKSIHWVVVRCVSRYFDVVQEVANDYQAMVWATPPQSMAEYSSHKFPTIGTGQERNAVARLFNKKLERLCIEADIPFISVFDDVVSPENVSDMDYFFDSAHLSQKALPFALEALADYL